MNIKHHYYLKKLLYRLSIVYALYTFTRIVFLLFNYRLFENVSALNILKTLAAGIIFDTNAIIYTNALFMLFWLLPNPFREKKFAQRIAYIYYVAINSIALLTNCIDTIFFKFSQRRMTVEVLSFNTDIQHQAFDYVFHYWYLFLIGLFCIIALIRTYASDTAQPVTIVSKGKQWIVLVVFAGLASIGLHGWGDKRPITPSDATRYCPAGWEQAVLCSPCTFINSLQYLSLKDPSFYAEDKAESMSGVTDNNYISNKESLPAAWQHLHNPNVVIIIVESLSRDYCGYFNNGKGYTPFLDSLFAHSIICTNGFANARHSIEGIPAVLSGLPNFMEQPFIASMYQTNNVTSLAHYLGDIGYSSAFIHGAHDNSMGFFGYSHRAGFDKVYGKKAYPNQKDYDGEWGIYDHHYLAFACDKISEMHMPFMAGIFTVSSHEPYSLPKDISVKFPIGPDPICTSIAYADWSIRQFFKKASSEPWYKNTIFIITADHCGPALNKKSRTHAGLYQVPIAFFCPSVDTSINIPHPVQQVDIMPTILQMLHLTPQRGSTLFGESILGNKRHHIVEYADDVYQIITDSIILTMNKNYETMGMFNYITDTLEHKNMIGLMPEKAKGLNDTLKAYIQVFDNAMINNTLKK